MPNNKFPHPMNDWLQTYRTQRRVLPAVIGNEAVNFFRDSFRAQGFTGYRFEKWPQRKFKKDKGRAILIKSGALRNSIRVKKAEFNLVVVASDKPYAAIHNEGFRGTESVKAHTRNRFSKSKEGTGVFSLKTRKERQKTVRKISGTVKVKAHTRHMRMPKRQFMGDSPYLDTKIERHITAMFLKTFK